MTEEVHDLNNVIVELEEALVLMHAKKEERLQSWQQFQTVDSQYDEAVVNFNNVNRILQYCLLHKCDSTYAKLMINEDEQDDTPVGSGLYHTACEPRDPRNRMQRWIDRLLRRR